MFIAHIVQNIYYPYIPQYLHLVNGYIAQGSVMIFFIMSGFLIGTSIQKNILKNNNFVFSQYLKDRIIRVYPSLLIILFFMLIFSFIKVILEKRFGLLIFQKVPYFSIKNFINGSLFLNGFTVGSFSLNSPLWSLAIEFWLYIIISLFFLKSKVLKMMGLFLFIIGFFLNPEFIFSIIWLLAFLLSFFSIRKFGKKILIFISLICLISFCWFIYYPINLIYNRGYNISFGLFLIFLFIFSLRFNFLKINFLKNWAKFSYSLYIFHMPIIIILSQLPINIYLQTILIFLTVITISYFSAKIFENKENVLKILNL